MVGILCTDPSVLEELDSYEAIRVMSIIIKVIIENSGLEKYGRAISDYHAVIKWW